MRYTHKNHVAKTTTAAEAAVAGTLEINDPAG
jgi:hypothetical protein